MLESIDAVRRVELLTFAVQVSFWLFLYGSWCFSKEGRTGHKTLEMLKPHKHLRIADLAKGLG
jgi:hypothetical protein